LRLQAGSAKRGSLGLGLCSVSPSSTLPSCPPRARACRAVWIGLRRPWAATLRRVENRSRPHRPVIALCALMNAAGVGIEPVAGLSRMSQHSFVIKLSTNTGGRRTGLSVADLVRRTDVLPVCAYCQEILLGALGRRRLRVHHRPQAFFLEELHDDRRDSLGPGDQE